MRLSKQVKQAIFDAAVVKAGIPAKQAAIRLRYADWAEAVRVRYVTPEVEALISAAEAASNAVPERCKSRSFCKTENAGIMYANVGGQRRSVRFNGLLRYEEGKDITRVAPDDYHVELTADDPLTEQLYAIDHDADRLKAEIEQLSASLWAVLNSVRTDKRLVEVWPEAIAFIPAAEKASTSNLPALPIADLNKLIGLP